MSFTEPAPMVQTNVVPRYPALNWRKPAEVRECWLPNEKPVGWLVIQDDEALSWLSSVGPSRPAAYAVKEIVQDTITLALAENRTAREAFNLASAAAMFRASEDMDLDKFAKRLSEEWS